MNTLIKNHRRSFPERMAVSPDRAVRRMDSSFFLFLYTPDQQRRADRAVHDSGGGKSAVL